jgi:ABC-type multidrug transport system, ATPase and permease components
MFASLKKNNLKYKRVFQLLHYTEKMQFIRLVLLDALSSVIDILTLAAFVFIMRYILVPDLSTAPKVVRFIFDHLFLSAICLTSLFFIKNIGAYYLGSLEQRFVYKVATRISEERLEAYFELPFSEYTSKNSSTFVYEISHLPVEFCHYMLRSLHQLLGQLILTLITVGTILIYKPTVFLLLLAILVPVGALITYLLKTKSISLRKNAKKANEITLKYLQESLQGYVESKIFNSKDFFKKRYIKEQGNLNSYLAGIQSLQVLPSRIMESFAIGAFFILLIIVRSDTSHLISITTTAAFMAAAYKLIPALSRIINAYNNLHTYQFTIDKLTSLPGIYKNTFANASPLHHIEFRNISFKQHTDHLINDLNFSISKGDFVGFNGASGKGKTTLINLLLGFYDHHDGEILFNGVSTSSSDRLSYLKYISYVKQQPFLIDDSLLRNVTLNEYKKEDDLNDIFAITDMKNLINGNGKAEQKKIYQDGKNISGGQRQRITFARGLSKEFDLLILDEPFSELDPESEIKMVMHLKELSDNGKMVLLISHNSQSLQYCNKIISFDE